MKNRLTFIALLLLVITGISFAQTSNYFNGFETTVGNAAGGNWAGVTIQTNGYNDIPSSNGAFYGEAPAGVFTRYGGYNSVFPAWGYKTSVDIYLNVDGGYANDTRFDFSSAISKSDGNHLRDFIITGGFYNDATGPGVANTNRFIFSASNNSPGWPKNPGRSPIAISSTGWYTFEHYFHDNGSGILAVDISIYNRAHVLMGSWTLSNPGDVIGSVVGGNRYGWFVTNGFGTLAIDNTSLTVLPAPPVHNITQDTYFQQIQPAIDAANPGDVINVDAGTYAEVVNINKPLTLNGANANVACDSHGAESMLAPTSGVPFNITANGVTINGFEITAPSANYAIVASKRSDINIKFNNIHDVGITVTSGNIHAVVDQIPDDVANTNVNITDNCFKNIGNSNTGGSVSAIGILQSVSKQTITGLNILRNTISDINANTSNKGAYGIQINVGSKGYGGAAINAVVSDNKISNLKGWWAHGIGLEGHTPNAVVENNIITLLISSQPSYPNDAVGIKIEDNPGTTLEIHNNSFTNMAIGILNSVAGTSANGTCNWWGDASGPNGAGTGTGVAVYGNVVYYPWSLSFPSNYCGPIAKVEKQFAKDELVDYLSGNPDKKIGKQVEKAIESIDKSLESELWADPNHLTKKGNKVFDEEKHAVKELTDKKNGGEFGSAINHLMAADLTLAQVAINDAVAACNGDKNCQHEIDKANEEMTKAAKELAENDYDKAIDHYKKAWEHAQKVLKKSDKSAEDDAAEINDESLSLDKIVNIPENFSLNQNYPNPFNPSTVIKFALPEASFVTLKIYNMLGQEIKTLVSGNRAAGYYSIQWNGDDNFGNHVASGAYIYRITAGNNVVNRKMILMK